MEFKIDYIIDDIKEFIQSRENSIGNNDLLYNEFEQKKKISHIILNLHASDQAIVLVKLKENERTVFVQEFTSALHEDIILFLETPLLYEFFQTVGLEKFLYFIALLEFDETVEVLEKLDETHRKDIMQLLPFKKRVKLKRSLSYPEYSCGRNMSIDFLSVPYWWTVARTKKYIKDSKNAIKNEEDVVFITDEDSKIVGTTPIIQLLNESESNLIGNFIEGDVISAKAYDYIPDIQHLFDQYDLDIIPVTNKNNNIVGVLEISDVTEYLQETSDKQILRSVGIFDSRSNKVLGIAKLRFLWLVIDLCTAIVASYFISLFEDSIAKVTTLAVLMPIVSTLGGNCGSQTATVIIRSIFVGNITRKQMWTEIIVAIISGVGLSILCFLGVWWFFSNIVLGAIFGASVMTTLAMAGVCGVFIPITLEKFKIDPPVGTSILLTTLTDICGFVTILSLGTIFLL